MPVNLLSAVFPSVVTCTVGNLKAGTRQSVSICTLCERTPSHLTGVIETQKQRKVQDLSHLLSRILTVRCLSNELINF